MSTGSAIAVVGIACRLPGAPSPDAFWRLLRAGEDAISDAPTDRWALDELSAADRSLPGLLRGGFLERIDEFDRRLLRHLPARRPRAWTPSSV